MMDYDQLLKRARDRMPAVVFEKARFEIPKVRGHLQGSRTVISNFLQIASTLRREPEHLLKYLLRELATPGSPNRDSLVLGSKVPASRINDKIKQYAHEFVLCPSCGKPDTDLLREGEFTFLRCSVCGTKTTVKSKI